MAGETRIIAFGPGGEEAARDEILLTEEVPPPETGAAETEQEELEPFRLRSDWLLPALAFGAGAVWTAFFAWARLAQSPLPAESGGWTGLIADWAVPVLLICTVWLLLMRNSRREAMRFGDTARVLSEESGRLEAHLVTVNRELSLAREFIAAQARDLEALGRLATERLSVNADKLQDLIQENSARIDTIGKVSDAALTNMERLRGQLPVIASSAKDITNNIANAGRTAHAQLADMRSGFERLNQFGNASEQQVLKLRSLVEEVIAEFTRQCDQMDNIATNRFAALTQEGADFRTQLETHEVEALAAIRSRASSLTEELDQTRRQLDDHEAESLTSLRARLSGLRDESAAVSRALRDGESRAVESWQASLEQLKEEMAAAIASLEEADSAAVEAIRARIEALGEELATLDERIAERNRAFDEEIARRRSDSEASDHEVLMRLSQRLEAFDAEIAARRTAHEEQGTAIAARSEAIAARLAECERQMGEIAALGSQTESGIAAGIQALADKLAEARSSLAGTDGQIAGLTDASVRLLELLQASSTMSQDDLQRALATNEESLADVESRIARLRVALDEASKGGEGLSALIEASGTDLAQIDAEFEERQQALDRRGADYAATLSQLREALEAIEQQSDRLAEKAQGELSEAIEKLKAAAREAITAIGTEGGTAVSALAGQLGEESAAAIDKAMHITVSETAGQLEQAAAHAAGASREAAVQLRDQLAKVNELVGNLERRVAHARERAEEQVDNDFSRRVALITESLNSNAIDIARALSTDVSDTAWASYLRGDRGIFTRRAVNLLDSGEARGIAQIFENDRDFREHVSRYIHDFEAILRQVLSTRDGHSLGVTLLSSDMGKLYVALAQSIERLRG